MSEQPIADYGLLSDRHSAALVGRDGSVDWLGFPRFDSPSVFGRLLDADAGAWTIRPTGADDDATDVRRSYVSDTLVLRTTFVTPSGSVELTDALVVTDPRTNGIPDVATEDPHRLGEHAPHTLIRRLRGISGAVELEIVVRPRPEYGLIVPLLTQADGSVRCAGARVGCCSPPPSTGTSTAARLGRPFASLPVRHSASRCSTRISPTRRCSRTPPNRSIHRCRPRSPRGGTGRPSTRPMTGRGATSCCSPVGCCKA